MTKIIFVFLSIIFIIQVQNFAQSNIDSLLKEGIQFHDQGEYKKAIETYKKALIMEPNSTLVNYEIALSYFSNGDYEDAIKYSDVVIKQHSDNLIQSYIVKGSALDMLGKTKKSIKLFEKALKKTNGHYLLHYNLGIDYFRLNDITKAEDNFLKAIENKPNHSSSHLMLAEIHYRKGNSVQTLLAIHYFLFLEPNSKRSARAHQILQEKFKGNVSKDKNEPNTINISISPNDNNHFDSVELLISMLSASKSLEENEGKTDDELFIENTNSFFTMLGGLKKEKYKGIWWTFYTPFFYELAKSEHFETYCRYITQSGNENSKSWLMKNKVKVNEFENWLKEK